jgi:hypothetical protein
VKVSDWPEHSLETTNKKETNDKMNTSVNGFFPRVSLGFAKKIDTDLIAFVRNLVTMMTGNPKYPTPIPALTVVTTSVNAFEVAVQDGLDGGKIAIATRNAARVELLSLIRQLAAYVQTNCEADLVILLGSGFEAVRAPSPVGVLPAPANQRLDYTGNSGELLLRFDRVVNADSYSVEVAADPAGPWEHQTVTTNTRAIVDGLTPGKVCWVRACANGSQGPSPWGGPATVMAV